MLEREKCRVERQLSITAEPGESRARRNFIDPILLEAAKDTYAGAATVIAGGAGIGLAGAGIGIGSYFYQRGRAEEIRANKGVESSRVRTGSRERAETSSQEPTQ